MATGITPRAYHTASLLTDGRILITGGISEQGTTLGSIELWNFRTNTCTALASELLVPRSKHTASLLADGTVLLWGGVNKTDTKLNFGEVFDASLLRTRMETAPVLATTSKPPQLEASLPVDGTPNVPTDTLLAIRFSKSLAVTSINTGTVTLSGPDGSVTTKVSAAEGGMLAFAIPSSDLVPGITYTVSLSGLTDGTNAIADSILSFTTAGIAPSVPTGIAGGGADPDDTGAAALNSSFRKLPPLEAPPGVTAIGGQVLRLNGLPLPNVTLSIGTESAKTDKTGRFLISNTASGHQVMLIDG